MTGVMQTPQAPAKAYAVVAELLSPDYFLTPPPAAGIRLTVAGADFVRTYWDFNEATAQHVLARLRVDPRIRYTAGTTYVDAVAK